MPALNFYRCHSTFTDPSSFSYLFDDLPRDVGSIKSLLQGLILHFWDGSLFDYQIPLKRIFDIETRYVSKMLEKIVSLDDSSLLLERDLDRRLVGSCRDYAVLFCAILRHHGVPARTRVAFSSYYFKDSNHDEVILEYWNDEKSKWCLVDPRVTAPHIERQKIDIDFDLLDVPRDKLILAGLAWKTVRENPALAEKFYGGDKEKNKGMWYVRDRLIQDVAALNSVEMQLWDAWGLMFGERDVEYDQTQLLYLDQLADLTLTVDENFNQLREAYLYDERLRVPAKITSFSPVYRKKEITLSL